MQKPVFENSLHFKIWAEIEKRLMGVGKKDYILHLAMVVRAMQELIQGEGGDSDILIPCAMLHDIGWSRVEKSLLFPKTDEEKERAEEAHIREAKPIINEILRSLNYSNSEIKEIIRIVQLHKSKDPGGDKSIECMIDADNLSDTYQEAFYSDVKSYKSTPEDAHKFRSKNKFFSKTANLVFKRELKERLKEIKNGEAEQLLNQ